jgi:hypothetical protein
LEAEEMTPDKKEISRMIEQLDRGQSLLFKLPETFGDSYVVVEINSQHPQKGQKKYMMRLGRDEETARRANPFWSSDKPKQLAAWVSDRLGELRDRPPPLKGVA